MSNLQVNSLDRYLDKFFPGPLKGILFFFSTLPLAYAMQVIGGLPQYAVVPYMGLFYGVIVFALMEFGGKAAGRDFFVGKLIPTSLVILILGHNLISTLYFCTLGDFQFGIRALILFTLPWSLYFIVLRATDRFLEKILITISALSFVVGLEGLYESINSHLLHRVTPFQQQNSAYVFSRIGKELSQLATPGYRPPGLLEHVHVLSTFLAIGAYASFALYIWRAKAIWLVVGLFISFFLLSHGVRLTSVVFLVGIFSVVSICFFLKNVDLSKKNLLNIQVGVVFVVFIQLVLDPIGTSARYYYPAILDGNFQFNTDVDTTTHIGYIVKSLAGSSSLAKVSSGDWSYSFQSLVGYGLVGSLKGSNGFNDDVFIFALLEQYGIIFFLCFYFLLVYSIVWGGAKLLVVECREKIILGIFAVLVLVTLIASTLHSSVLQRKVIYPLLPLTVAVLARNFTKK